MQKWPIKANGKGKFRSVDVHAAAYDRQIYAHCIDESMRESYSMTHWAPLKLSNIINVP